MKKTVRKLKNFEKNTDFDWWQSKTFIERLIALEQIREEYNIWKYGNKQGFQRVYRVLKQT